MTNEQLYFAIGFPVIFNTIVVGLSYASLRSEMKTGFTAANNDSTTYVIYGGRNCGEFKRSLTLD